MKKALHLNATSLSPRNKHWKHYIFKFITHKILRLQRGQIARTKFYFANTFSSENKKRCIKMLLNSCYLLTFQCIFLYFFKRTRRNWAEQRIWAWFVSSFMHKTWTVFTKKPYKNLDYSCCNPWVLGTRHNQSYFGDKLHCTALQIAQSSYEYWVADDRDGKS